jgi:hypothetical protein
MAKKPSRPIDRKLIKTDAFSRWFRDLDPERQAKVSGTTATIVKRGPTLGRPNVDTLHGSRLNKLKEARIDRGTRVLFAFDSNQNAVMLVGGDKTGKWDRWYRTKIRQAERLYDDHERSTGRGVEWLNRGAVARTASQRNQRSR